MKTSAEIQEMVFQEAKEILNKFSIITNSNELVEIENDIQRLQDFIAYFKISRKFSDQNSNPGNVDIFSTNSVVNVIEEMEFTLEDSNLDAEANFNNELNEIEETTLENNFHEDSDDLEEEAIYNNILNEISEDDLVISESLTNERVLKDVECSNVEEIETCQEKKIRLSIIKGIKKEHSLFDFDSQKENEQEESHQHNFIEEKANFKLDLNDRIAFSKMLFEGSQSDLNNTVHQLNNFTTLDEAKEYLSDLYYQKNWDKVDEYAQRLWSLVENKFQ